MSLYEKGNKYCRYLYKSAVIYVHGIVVSCYQIVICFILSCIHGSFLCESKITDIALTDSILLVRSTGILC